MAKQKNTKKILIIVALLITVGAALFALEKTGVTDIFKSGQDTTTGNEQSTSEVFTAQSDFTGADQRNPGNTLDENKGNAIINDTSGTPAGAVDTSNPIVSKTGEISLYSPKNSTQIDNSIEVSGASNLNKVSYRIIDNISGVISMGELSVTNGKFSGTLNVDTSAQDGRIDFYGTRPDGTEYSNIEVTVRFK